MIQTACEDKDKTEGVTLYGAGRREDFISGSWNIRYVSIINSVSKHDLYNERKSGVKKQ